MGEMASGIFARGLTIIMGENAAAEPASAARATSLEVIAIFSPLAQGD